MVLICLGVCQKAALTINEIMVVPTGGMYISD